MIDFAGKLQGGVLNLQCYNINEKNINEVIIFIRNHSNTDEKVTQLILRGNDLGYEEIEKLVNSGALTSITHLDLSENHGIGNEGVENIAISKKLPNLTNLNLEDTGIDDEEVKFIADCSTEIKLTTLNLNFNKITHYGCWSISVSKNFGNLAELDLSQTYIGDNGIKALSVSEKLANLIRLNLARNNESEQLEENITNVGMQYIADSTAFTNLEKLYLENLEEVTGDGIKFITLSKNLPKLKEMRVDECEDTDLMMQIVKGSVDNDRSVIFQSGIDSLVVNIYKIAHDMLSNEPAQVSCQLGQRIGELGQIDGGEKYEKYFREHQDEYPFDIQVLENQGEVSWDFSDPDLNIQGRLDDMFSGLANQQDVDLQGIIQNDMES